MSSEVPGSSWQDADGLHVDTRGLHPPDPMVAILWHIGRPGQFGPITAYFDRNPIFLLPELEELGWRYEYAMCEPDGVRLILRAAT
ncbi:hypothetical protein AVO45_00130 [Ruegeria marisrubri]|uniref:DUF2249 domain-containing protein n=1 Tax=Ruegeria marisrubri TaxID=1685379 RepID=A0A0X3UBI8_9RHOB|nr:DUF2249 domain-containing protein [Ruegeria marisrubri]KUJ85447.1 hypothetical protein AVO45_00130 [Ruegeria marisrubri]